MNPAVSPDVLHGLAWLGVRGVVQQNNIAAATSEAVAGLSSLARAVHLEEMAARGVPSPQSARSQCVGFPLVGRVAKPVVLRARRGVNRSSPPMSGMHTNAKLGRSVTQQGVAFK